MDGWAVRRADAETAATGLAHRRRERRRPRPRRGSSSPGEAVRIFTGALVPPERRHGGDPGGARSATATACAVGPRRQAPPTSARAAATSAPATCCWSPADPPRPVADLPGRRRPARATSVRGQGAPRLHAADHRRGAGAGGDRARPLPDLQFRRPQPVRPWPRPGAPSVAARSAAPATARTRSWPPWTGSLADLIVTVGGASVGRPRPGQAGPARGSGLDLDGRDREACAPASRPGSGPWATAARCWACPATRPRPSSAPSCSCGRCWPPGEGALARAPRSLRPPGGAARPHRPPRALDARRRHLAPRRDLHRPALLGPGFVPRRRLRPRRRAHAAAGGRARARPWGTWSR